MRSMPTIIGFVGVLSLLGCERTVEKEEGLLLDPQVSISQPSTLSQFREYESIVFAGTVEGVGAPSQYTGVWTSDVDGQIYTETLGVTGNSQFSYADLSPGNHEISFSIDLGEAGVYSDGISIEIIDEIDAPTVSLVSPEGNYSAAGQPIPFAVLIDDLQDTPDLIAVEGASLERGVFCNVYPDASGVANCTETLPVGEYQITFTATDTHGYQGELTFPWSVLPLTQIDDDGDGYTEEEGDCDDADPSLYPTAEEVVDSIDNDCNGYVDDQTPYFDDDGDCFCETLPCNGTITTCDVLAGGDCNDASGLDYPNGEERCDGLDNNCDGTVDEYTAVDATVWYVDVDLDGFGSSAAVQPACTQPVGYAGNDGDCDDNDATVNPAATEQPNGVDDDCDGIVDDNTVNYDDDADGFTENDGDCDDTTPMVNPAQTEVINAIDDDCNGLMDDQTVIYDDDGDGYSENQGDCDDANPNVSPIVLEVCGNGIDDNCNGTENEINAIDCIDFYHDADGDGFGGSFYPSECWCEPGGNSGMLNVTDGGDCMDNTMPQSTDVFPGQTQYFDVDRGDGSFDYDCSGSEDKFNDQLGSCTWSWGTCDIDNVGWVGSVPANCGDTGEFINDDDHCSGFFNCEIDQGALLFPYIMSCR